MRERRQFVRTNGLVLVNFKVPDEHLEGKSSAFDVSGAGLRITVDKQLAAGAQIEMELYLPGNSQPILARGRIVWSQKCKQETVNIQASAKEYFFAGIKFTAIDENNRERIISYVRRKSQQSKEKA